MTGPNNYFKKSCISLFNERKDCRKSSDFKITLNNAHSHGRHSSNEITKCLGRNSIHSFIHSFIHSGTWTQNSYKKHHYPAKTIQIRECHNYMLRLSSSYVPVPLLPPKLSMFGFRMHACMYALMYIVHIPYLVPKINLGQITGYPFNMFLFFLSIFLTNLSTWNYVILSILCHNSIMGQ